MIDSSGSMKGGRMEMAIDAATKVVDTLTETDYVSVVDFSTSAVSFSDRLVSATTANLQDVKDWIKVVQANGNTNFNAAFEKAWDIFRNTGSEGSGCNKVLPPSQPRTELARCPPSTHPRQEGPLLVPMCLSHVWQVLLFLTDGMPNEPWGDAEYAGVKQQVAELRKLQPLCARGCSHTCKRLWPCLSRPPSSTCT